VPEFRPACPSRHPRETAPELHATYRSAGRCLPRTRAMCCTRPPGRHRAMASSATTMCPITKSTRHPCQPARPGR
jgi:hypothetical protein